ncbi:non-ribosomal peptide synthetase [Nocardia sp. NBC_01009]|uniref:non-ribosomal peptide synthetase n=1 Tax=Nocardia sp. NBC_01009 TaxID=2975996 RepID=UPI003869FF8D|nr:non-ribosomal peptide synthetase [Nocardia sp. NBC_01009]
MQTPDEVPLQPPNRSWLQRLDEQNFGVAHEVALIGSQLTLTYQDLDHWVGRICRELTEAGVAESDSVAVVVPQRRNPYTTAAMLAIWRLGAVYVPLAADQPQERTRSMLAVCAIRFALLEPGNPPPTLPEEIVTVTIPSPDTVDAARQDPPTYPAIDPDDLAYVIFTSGSSGAPKGVAVPHRGIAAMADATAAALELRPGARMLQFAPASFDASIAEITSTLGAGATAVFAAHDALTDGVGIAEVIVAQRISHAIMVPSVLAAIPEHKMPPGLRLIIAGEAANSAVVEEWTVRHHLINSYGPTETTVCATISDPLVGAALPIPIGRAIEGTTLRIVGDDGTDTEPGAAGELWIGGLGVAHGYLGLPQETAAAFIDDLVTGRRFYRSGDLVRQLPDGQLEFLGRMDRRIKLRGRRIEPGEIETIALRCPGVRQAAVVSTDTQLVCCIVVDDAIGASEVKGFLTEHLPGYLLPDRVEIRTELPRTPHGKTDYAAVTESVRQTGSHRTAPETMTPAERVLCELFAETLSLPEFHPADSFFDLGGESMEAAKLTRRIRTALGVHMTMRMLLDAPSPAQLAALLSISESELVIGR